MNTLDTAQSWSGTRIGATRTEAPGTRDVRLGDGKYVVYFEVDEDTVPPDVDDGLGDIRVPRELGVTIRRGGDGRPLRLDDYATNFQVSGGDRAARAVWTVEVPEAGRYRIGATGAPRAVDPAVVLGRPVGSRVLRLIGGIVTIVAGFGLATLVAVLAVVAAVRRSRN